jgi:hypothetical protein
VKLRLGIAACAFEDACYFRMVEALNIVKEKDAAIPWRHCSQGPIDGEAVDDSSLRQIANSKTASRAFLWNVFHQQVERDNGERVLAQVHQNSVDGKSMEPRRKSRVAAKQRDSTVDLVVCFLGEIFSECEVSNHAHAD